MYMDADPDGKTKNIYREKITDGERTVVIDGKSLVIHLGNEPIPITGFQATEDGQYFLIKGPSKQADFLYVSPPKEASHYLYDTLKNVLRPLSGIAGAQQHAKLSPDGRKICFIRDGNLFMVDLISGIETQLTFDGNKDILNGVNKGSEADGWHWSPDSKHIAFIRVDQTAVQAIPLLDYLTPYPKIHWVKYPKAGETNWKLRIGVLHLETGETTWLHLGPDTDVYFPNLKWTRKPDLVAVERLNRQQNKLELLFAKITTGESRVILTETDPCWVRTDEDLTFFKNTDSFIWTSQRSGYNHAYLYDYDGNLLNQITCGDWEMNAARARNAVLGVDEENGWLYFSGKKDGVVELHIYRIKLDGQDLQRLSHKPGWHDASLSADAKYFLDTFSDVKTPPQISMHRADGTVVRCLRKGEILGLAKFDLVNPEFLTVPTSDGENLNAVMIKPAEFDPNKKYPVIFYCYGGVSSQTVVNQWGSARGLWHQLMAQKGYIVFTVDNRGTGNRGKTFENYMYQNLGTWPLRDHIEAAKYLGSLSYVDPSRIGIWGRSGGGYLTCFALTEGSDYFKVGVAHATVTNYLFYSSSWAERYMGLPQENKAAYDKEAVVTYAHKLKGHLLLVHGMADDNVQLQNTVEVAEAFQALNKQFDLMYYHGRDHPIRGGNTQLHLFTQMTEYFLRHLPPNVACP
jgi:dipeptidyl-peptidase-4